MSRDNRIHSFTLNPGASELIQQVKKGNKSKFVSNAITWYAKPREFITKKYEYHKIDGQTGETEYRIKILDICDLVEAQDSLLEKYQKVVMERNELRDKYANRFKFWKK